MTHPRRYNNGIGSVLAVAPLREPPLVDAGGSEDSNGEFERFEDLTEALLRVPKKELDEKLKEA
jgi:hypothetical protein